MRLIYILWLIVSVGIVSTYGHPLKTSDVSVSTPKSSLIEAQSKEKPGSDPPKSHETNSSEETPTVTSSSVDEERRFFEVLKEPFPPDAFSEDSTSTPFDNNYEDKVTNEDDVVDEDTYPEGLRIRLSATLLKILT